MADIMNFSPLWNKWHIKRLLGKGTFGAVYEAVMEEYGKTYTSAIKHIQIPLEGTTAAGIISEGLATDEVTVVTYLEGMRDRLLDEITICYKLKGNTNIVSYEDHMVVERPDRMGYDIFIRMEYLTSLPDYMSNRSMNEQEITKLGIDICTALSVMDKKKMVHRDIKPANIMVNDDGVFKLGDFGEAKALEQTVGGMSVRGTYAYMAPEVYKSEYANRTVDIYSLGMVLYRMLNGNRPPFTGDRSIQLTSEMAEQSNSRRFRGEELPEPIYCTNKALAGVILKACKYNPNNRWQDADEFANALRQSLLQPNVPVDDGTVIVNDMQNQNIGYVPYSVNPAYQMTQNNVYQQYINTGNYDGNFQQGIMPQYYNMPPQMVSGYTPNQGMPQMNMPVMESSYKGDEIVIPAKKNNSVLISIIVSLILICITGISIYFIRRDDADKDVNNLSSEQFDDYEKDREDEEKFSVRSNVSKEETSNTTNATTELMTEADIEKMPLCVSRSCQDVIEELEGMGMKVVISRETSNDVEKDYVISQNFPEGSELSTGSTITLVVSDGPQPCPYEYEQKVTVVGTATSSYASLTLYNWEKGDWVKQYSCSARVGQNGVGPNYGEGTSITPEGVFKLGIILCDEQPSGNMPYQLVSTSTCIVDDVGSSRYNVICDTSDLPADVSRDTIGNTIINGNLDKAIFIEHNGNGFSSENVVAGKGSVITICGVNYSPVATLGCVDISASDLNSLISLLDTEKNPHIEIIGE